MKTVAEILKAKGGQTVHAIASIGTVLDALKLMAEKDIGALIVLENDRIVGMFSERDYARKLVLVARSSRDTPVRDVMTTSVTYVRPDRPTEECMALMTDNRVRHLPVMDGEKLLGLISMGDLVKDIISEQKIVIEQLGNYISGERR